MLSTSSSTQFKNSKNKQAPQALTLDEMPSTPVTISCQQMMIEIPDFSTIADHSLHLPKEGCSCSGATNKNKFSPQAHHFNPWNITNLSVPTSPRSAASLTEVTSSWNWLSKESTNQVEQQTSISVSDITDPPATLHFGTPAVSPPLAPRALLPSTVAGKGHHDTLVTVAKVRFVPSSSDPSKNTHLFTLSFLFWSTWWLPARSQAPFSQHFYTSGHCCPTVLMKTDSTSHYSKALPWSLYLLDIPGMPTSYDGNHRTCPSPWLPFCL